jgi:hypothetical protein
MLIYITKAKKISRLSAFKAYADSSNRRQRALYRSHRNFQMPNVIQHRRMARGFALSQASASKRRAARLLADNSAAANQIGSNWESSCVFNLHGENDAIYPNTMHKKRY